MPTPDPRPLEALPPLETDGLSTFLESLQIGVIIRGPAHEILYANPRASMLLRLTSEQLHGLEPVPTTWTIAREDGTPCAASDHPSTVVLREGRPVHDVILGVSESEEAERVWLLVRADPVLDTFGRVEQVVVTFDDITALRRAQSEKLRALQEAEQFRSALDLVPAYVYIKDRDSRYRYANAPTLDLFGISAAELPGSPDARFFPPETVERLRALDLRVHGGERTQEEVTVPGAGGSRHVYLELKSPLTPLEPGGAVPGLLGISIDITEQRRSEERLHRRGAFYAALAQCYEAITRGVGEQELFEEVCRAAVQVAGVRMAWVGLEDPTTHLVLPLASFGDEQGYLDGLVISTDANDPRGQGPTGIAVRTGQQFWLDDFMRDSRMTPWREKAIRSGWVSSAAVPFFRRGICVGALTLYATERDTFDDEVRRLLADLARGIGLALDRLTAERERVAAEARLRLEGAALGAAANAIVITDREARIETVNMAFTLSTGFTAEEAVGKRFGDLVSSGKHTRAFWKEVWDTILAGKVWRGEIINRRKDGREFVEETTITPVRDASGAISHFVAVKQDITDRRALEEQFRQSQKMESIGRLAGGVAHDFNNMLSVILGRTELALSQVDEHSPLYEDLQEILVAGRRSADLTRQLLAFARKQSVSPKPVDLSREVAQSLKLLTRLITEDIPLRSSLASELWTVHLDPSQLDQILANLAVNSRDAIRAARDADPARLVVDEVFITTQNCVLDAAFCAKHVGAVPGEYVLLSVRDTGCGMSTEVQRTMFEPFFTTKAAGEGTGLGLSMVFGAVQQNRGFVDVTSAPGQGAKFDIYFPRLLVEQASATSATPSKPRGGSETVLVVEDDPSVLHLTTTALKRFGYRVLTADSPAMALDVAASHVGTIDLVLSDVIMPEMNGRDLTNLLQQRMPGLKRLLMSGYTADVLSGPAGEMDPNLLIPKPFSLTTLAERVREVLDGA